MFVSFMILFGVISVCVSALLTYSAVVVAARAQNSMNNLPVQSTQDLRYEKRFGPYEKTPAMVIAS